MKGFSGIPRTVIKHFWFFCVILWKCTPKRANKLSHVPWPIEDPLSTFLNSSLSRDEIYRAMKSKHRAISGKLSRDKWNGNLLGRTWSVTHVVSVAATVEEVCFEVNSSWKDHWAALCNTSMTHSSVNQYNKPWFCEILRDTCSGRGLSISG